MIKTAFTAAALAIPTLAMAQAIPTTPSTKPATSAPSAGSSSAPSAGSASGTSAAAPSPSSSSGTSGSGASAQMSPADVKQLLEREGYSDVTDVKESGSGFTATAMKSGKETQVEIDGAGKVTAKR